MKYFVFYEYRGSHQTVVFEREEEAINWLNNFKQNMGDDGKIHDVVCGERLTVLDLQCKNNFYQQY
jgi:hypothetical protein